MGISAFILTFPKATIMNTNWAFAVRTYEVWK